MLSRVVSAIARSEVVTRAPVGWAAALGLSRAGGPQHVPVHHKVVAMSPAINVRCTTVAVGLNLTDDDLEETVARR